jgi:outer membrane protein
MRRATALLAVVLLALSAWGQDTPQASVETLTLDQAVALATQNNRQVKSSALGVEISQEGVTAARTQRLPVFNLYVLESQLLAPVNFLVQEGQFGTYPGIGPIPATNTNITTPLRPTTFIYATATQPLSQLHHINLAIEEQKVAVDLARESVRQERQSIADQVKQAYYSILQSQSALDVAQQTLKFNIELDQLTDRYVAQEVALKSDSLNVKAQLAQTKYQIVTLQDTLQTQKENLNELLGRELRTPFSVQAVPEAAAYELDLEGAQRRALNQRPEIRQAMLKAKQTQLDVRVQKSLSIPDVSATVTYLSPFNVDFVPKNIASVGLSLSWQPYDWGYKKSGRAQKTLTSRQAELALQETRQQVLVDVDNHFRKLADARILVQVNQMTQRTEQEKLRVVMNQYKERANLLKDVLQEQASLANANYQYQQALLSFWTAKADLEKSLGEE